STQRRARSGPKVPKPRRHVARRRLPSPHARKRSVVERAASIEEVQRLLEEQRYIADRSLAVSIHLALVLGKPLFLEGEAGVGKTEVAKVLANGLRRRLIRLQCYEGL